MLDIDLKYSWIAAGNALPNRIVIVMHATLCAAPIVQKTVDRLPYETEGRFIERVMYFAKELTRPHGLGHHAELHCKYGGEASDKSNDRIANLEHLLWHSANNDKSYQVRAQALVTLSKLYGAVSELTP